MFLPLRKPLPKPVLLQPPPRFSSGHPFLTHIYLIQFKLFFSHWMSCISFIFKHFIITVLLKLYFKITFSQEDRGFSCSTLLFQAFWNHFLFSIMDWIVYLKICVYAGTYNVPLLGKRIFVDVIKVRILR